MLLLLLVIEVLAFVVSQLVAVVRLQEIRHLQKLLLLYLPVLPLQELPLPELPLQHLIDQPVRGGDLLGARLHLRRPTQ